MKTDDVRAARRANLKLELERPGVVRRDLGVQMGWADGSFLGQMVNGHRPITEEIARLLEEKLLLPKKSLDLPPAMFAKRSISPKRQALAGSKAAQENARYASLALLTLAEVLAKMPEALEPTVIGKAATKVSQDAARLGLLTEAQVRKIVDGLV